MGTIVPTLDHVHDSWAMAVCGDGLAHMKLTDSRK